MGEVVGIGTERAVLVQALETLLERAKSGELQVLIGVTFYSKDVANFVHCGALASHGDRITAYASIVGMMGALHHDVQRTLHGLLMDEEEDESEEGADE